LPWGSRTTRVRVREPEGKNSAQLMLPLASGASSGQTSSPSSSQLASSSSLGPSGSSTMPWAVMLPALGVSPALGVTISATGGALMVLTLVSGQPARMGSKCARVDRIVEAPNGVPRGGKEGPPW
jgi:hypothetical protein